MSHSKDIFGVALMVFWIGVILSHFLPINDAENLAVLAVCAFVIAYVMATLGDKDKLF